MSSMPDSGGARFNRRKRKPGGIGQKRSRSRVQARFELRQLTKKEQPVVEAEPSRFAGHMARPYPQDTAPILHGAIAVCQSGTLTTDRVPYCFVLERLKSEAVPERFREAIELFTSYDNPNLPASDEADRVFRNLGWGGDGLGYAYDDRGGGENPFRGLCFQWSDEAAAKYISEQSFTAEELEWLWSVAQRLQSCEGHVPKRRSSIFGGGEST